MRGCSRLRGQVETLLVQNREFCMGRLQVFFRIVEVCRFLSLLHDSDEWSHPCHEDISESLLAVRAQCVHAQKCVLSLFVAELFGEFFRTFVALSCKMDCGTTDIVQQKPGARRRACVEQNALSSCSLSRLRGIFDVVLSDSCSRYGDKRSKVRTRDRVGMDI